MSGDATRTASDTGAQGDLRRGLDEIRAGFNERASDEIKTLYDWGVEQVERSGVLERAVGEGDAAPAFELEHATGERVSLSGLLARGPVVLVWYRGGWCPYCNLTLRAYQQRLDEIGSLGATLVAITPEVPDRSLSTAEKNRLGYRVLSDPGNVVARAFGLVFELPGEIHEQYQGAFDLHGFNGDESGELPLAATHVIAPDGRVSWAFLSADYRERAEPADVIAALRNLRA
ncbi:MAG: peroxiredoxin-like family protein [Planctomycetota bacterium]